MCDAVNARRGHPAGVEEHITCKKECTGSWEIPRLTSGNGTPWPASGRRGAEADDARTWEVGLCRRSYEAGEQGGAIRCGAGGAKGRDQGECGSAKHYDPKPGIVHPMKELIPLVDLQPIVGFVGIIRQQFNVVASVTVLAKQISRKARQIHKASSFRRPARGDCQYFDTAAAAYPMLTQANIRNSQNPRSA
jgi:hypothetical protein